MALGGQSRSFRFGGGSFVTIVSTALVPSSSSSTTTPGTGVQRHLSHQKSITFQDVFRVFLSFTPQGFGGFIGSGGLHSVYEATKGEVLGPVTSAKQTPHIHFLKTHRPSTRFRQPGRPSPHPQWQTSIHRPRISVHAPK
jgi:hypothetical protein